jgi:hypothetical protein
MSGPSEALRARVIAEDLKASARDTWQDEAIGMLRRYAGLIDAIGEMPIRMQTVIIDRARVLANKAHKAT